ncbi:hypothetical protein PSY31_22645, partial [Shigella flexneri]|nr:hypothetical protein [Shigella flexneri]
SIEQVGTFTNFFFFDTGEPFQLVALNYGKWRLHRLYLDITCHNVAGLPTPPLYSLNIGIIIICYSIIYGKLLFIDVILLNPIASTRIVHVLIC